MSAQTGRGLVGLDELSPFHKQLPFAVLFVAAMVISIIVPTLHISNATALVSGLGLVVGATLAAGLFSHPSWLRFAVVLPCLDFVAAGFLRHGTGESDSVYSSIVLLPVLWFAARPGRRNILYAVFGAILAIVVPFALGAQADNNPNELARGIFSTLVFALAALVVNELAARSRRRLQEARAEAAASEEELSRAAQIQRFLLPKEAAPLDGYETAGVCIPSKAVGGDFFDWYAIDEGLGFTLGDVMGKGAGAGMIAATTRAVIRSSRNSADPVSALVLTSDCLSTELSQAAAFATLFHARLRASDGRVLFSDAGHGLTLLIRSTGHWERLKSHELPVGLMPDTTWTTMEVTIHPGDMIVSFSDGVLDLYDGTLHAIGEVAALACEAASAQEIVDVIRTLATKSGNPDDVTVLAVRRSAKTMERASKTEAVFSASGG